MSATNLTKNLKLSQFVASDKPSWLGDVNGDNKKIDDGYGVLAGEISKANDTASSAKSQSDANTQTLTNVNSELEDYGNRITALEAGGGTEQLEQRVNTLGTDVEALQTRADTFEENITQNGTDITALKGRVDTIEPKVKANADNITSLQTSNTSILDEIQTLKEVNEIQNASITTASKDSTQALNKSSEAIAKTNQNTTDIRNLTSTVNIISSSNISLTQLTLNASSSYVYNCNPIFAIKEGTRTVKFLPFLIDFSSVSQNYVAIGTLSLPYSGTIAVGVGESSATSSIIWKSEINNATILTYFRVSGNTLTIYARSSTEGSGFLGEIVLPTIVYN